MYRTCVLNNLRFVLDIFRGKFPSTSNKNRKLFSLELYLPTYVGVARYTMNLSAVISQFENLAPITLAEPWDNVGLLVDQCTEKSISTILFTNDLTELVLHEAVQSNADLIYAYHPPIFASLKYLRKNEWKHRIVLTCIEKGIAVYSPHTALDACEEGVNDWLISCFDSISVKPIKPSSGMMSNQIHKVHCVMPSDLSASEITSLPGISMQLVSALPPIKFVNFISDDANLESLLNWLSKEKLAPISTSKNELPCIPVCGMGRSAKLKSRTSIQQMISLLKHHVNLKSLRVAFGKGHQLDTMISTVAVCAGSGASLLKDVEAELLVTGEMSHHELLDANHKGKTVLLCEHSNSERGYLPLLVKKLSLKLPNVKLHISKTDADPVVIL